VPEAVASAPAAVDGRAAARGRRSPEPRTEGQGAERLLTGFGRTAPSLARVSRPRRTDLAGMIAAAGERGILARGLGRSYGDAAQNAGGDVLATERLGSVGALDAQADLLTVGAGASLAELTRQLVPRGRFLPVVPGTAHVSVGGAIASDVHGKGHHVDGAFAAHVAGLRLVTPDGQERRVGPDRDTELFDATAGGMGLTGVVAEAQLRLRRIETSRMVVDTERADDLDDLMARMEEGDHRYGYTVAWVDCLASGARLGRSVLIRGDHARVDDLPAGGRPDPLELAPRRAPATPWAPPGLLRPSTARAFNELYFRRSPREERGRIEDLRSFFHPLDRIRDWNRLYGPRGFLQYQLVVPFGREGAVRAALERLSGAGAPAFLAVFKRLGVEAGPLSFPIPGWTLTLDLPAGAARLGELLDGLDQLVAEAGGRVYLAKDSRLRPELLPAMYPRLDEWRAVRERVDPDRRMRSDLARRLGLDR
jgi:decaprenylphospho-beta-D-ribofuranose 2-oxidase